MAFVAVPLGLSRFSVSYLREESSSSCSWKSPEVVQSAAAAACGPRNARLFFGSRDGVASRPVFQYVAGQDAPQDFSVSMQFGPRRNSSASNNGAGRQPVKDKVRINEMIRAPKVRVVDEAGEMIGVLTIDEALDKAEEAGVDLVEISNQDPPVCRLIDYGKFKYQQQKKASEIKKKSKQIEVKEIKLRPNIEVNDYNTKMRMAEKFIKGGDKIKFTLRFEGREMALKEVGYAVIDRVQNDLAEIAIVEQKPIMMGRQMILMMAPKPTM